MASHLNVLRISTSKTALHVTTTSPTVSLECAKPTMISVNIISDQVSVKY